MPHALITGASQGFGRALLAELVRRSWTCTVDARDTSALHAATADLPGVRAVPGDVADPGHRAALVNAARDPLDLLVHNASALGPSPLPALANYPLDALRHVYEIDVIAPLALTQLALPALRRASAPSVVMLSSDAAVEPYPGWGGYGSAKAALDQLAAVLGAEHPDLRVYAFDPGDMRTAMHQAAFPGEDISDRPEPATVVPALLRLLDDRPPSGRYRAADLFAATR
ncbi:MAG: short-chain dehydrogenase [Pseudonocardia sp.]|jgi:NAD(P)-dependent dehydrogenase (short-subunit alcohol dehydrogenase family)|nr:short-chain dehydrogenase [Pseudonocardia sp.]